MKGKHSRARTPAWAGRSRGRGASAPAGTRATACTRASGGSGDRPGKSAVDSRIHRGSEAAGTGPAGTGARAIFRREALEFRAGDRETGGGVVRLGAPWIRWCYRLTLALICAGLAVAGLARTAEYSYGRAAIEEPGGRFAALLPAAVLPDLAAARDLSVAWPGRGLRPVHILRLKARLATRSAVRRAGLGPATQPSVLLTGRLAMTGVTGTAPAGRPFVTQVALVLRSRPVAAILAREFEVMLGTRGAGR